MLSTLLVDPRRISDRAILLVGFAGARHRSETAELDRGSGDER